MHHQEENPNERDPAPSQIESGAPRCGNKAGPRVTSASPKQAITCFRHRPAPTSRSTRYVDMWTACCGLRARSWVTTAFRHTVFDDPHSRRPATRVYLFVTSWSCLGTQVWPSSRLTFNARSSKSERWRWLLGDMSLFRVLQDLHSNFLSS